jgi:glycolate oxidase iron-sulfur subunit
MQTNFSPEALKNPDISASNDILRKCVHCGFCTATCPTFTLLGDELDSPRGRIYLIKEMLEKGRPADSATVKHIDRCLSCLSCMTTCPSSVNYMHLVDHAREYIEKTYRRPLTDRLIRSLLALVLIRPRLFWLSLRGARLAKPFRGLLSPRLRAMVELAPSALPRSSSRVFPGVYPAVGLRCMRVALLQGCVQDVLDPRINRATIDLLNRHGVEVVIPRDTGCCGAMSHHMGRTMESHRLAKADIDAWMREIDGEGLDHIVINASGCGTTVKDYGYMFRNDPELAAKAATVSNRACDVVELFAKLDAENFVAVPELKIAYHSACSMQHGQKITTLPLELLARAGFEVVAIPEGHLCCGSAGTYNLLQPEISKRLLQRKISNIESTGCAAIATGNIGCIMQLAHGTVIPILHTVELLNWATGGPCPESLTPLVSDFKKRDPSKFDGKQGANGSVPRVGRGALLLSDKE